ncbi:hypothetical protein FPV67DRAFT_1171587 [Lyophyllum atratum]|nr:hypothetical protein FPV67DRAFT_1171587 [Lyophyllum atratum]
MNHTAETEYEEKRAVQPSQCSQCRGQDSSCQDDECSMSAHQSRCHSSRLRHVLLPALAALLTLSLLLALSCTNGAGALFGVDGLTKRATGDATGGNGGTFTQNKLYLIVVFVGLFVVILLGIMLSAWCCRGVFQNPLCCPCYLCACCGGLACLECIGCGLCAEGLDQIFMSLDISVYDLGLSWNSLAPLDLIPIHDLPIHVPLK